jgi:large subunit ribosomal protein L13
MNTQTDIHAIDAKGKAVGRVATEVASLLMGKHRTDIVHNIALPTKVAVSNVSKMRITEKKSAQKEYDRYSGYPGGRKVLTMQQMIARKGHTEILKKAVYGMLPKNKLRPVRMKHLSITD